jgi:hypothetical protein
VKIVPFTFLTRSGLSIVENVSDNQIQIMRHAYQSRDLKRVDCGDVITSLIRRERVRFEFEQLIHGLNMRRDITRCNDVRDGMGCGEVRRG